jgi:hypothetical protein
MPTLPLMLETVVPTSCDLHDLDQILRHELLFDLTPDGGETPSIRIGSDELRTVREAMRDLGSLLTELEDGDVEKRVLTQRNRMRAVVVSLEHWSKVERALAGQGTVEGE